MNIQPILYNYLIRAYYHSHMPNTCIVILCTFLYIIIINIAKYTHTGTHTRGHTQRHKHREHREGMGYIIQELHLEYRDDYTYIRHYVIQSYALRIIKRT